MSKPRICDKCDTVFSELEDGWQSFTATTNRIDPDTGEVVEVRQAMDACPACAVMPRRQFRKELEAKQAGDDLGARIAKLERETGLATEAPAE